MSLSSRSKFKNEHNSSSYRYVGTSLPRFVDNREVLRYNIHNCREGCSRL